MEPWVPDVVFATSPSVPEKYNHKREKGIENRPCASAYILVYVVVHIEKCSHSKQPVSYFKYSKGNRHWISNPMPVEKGREDENTTRKETVQPLVIQCRKYDW